MAVYGQWFSHVFFQRYGYVIPGYGVIGDHSPLGTSEFTHHDFVVAGDLGEVTDYYESVFGFISENDPVIDGAWQAGPQAIFMMEPGTFPLVQGICFAEQCQRQVEVLLTRWTS